MLLIIRIFMRFVKDYSCENNHLDSVPMSHLGQRYDTFWATRLEWKSIYGL